MDGLSEEEMMRLAIEESLKDQQALSQTEGGEGQEGGGTQNAEHREKECELEGDDMFREIVDEDKRGQPLAVLLEGNSWEKCDNDDDAITGHALSELPPERVVRFDVSSRRKREYVAEDTDAGAAGGGRDAGGEVELEVLGGEEGGSKTVVHGYDAVYLARWLSRDQRLPLTFHLVSKEDCLKVLRVMQETVSDDEVSVMMSKGELIRDKVTGKVRPPHSQGPVSRLVDAADGEYACLDWQYFLSEIDRLSAHIVAVRHQLMQDRSFGRRGDGHVRIQVLSEIEVRLDARRRQFQHIVVNFDASEVLADLYQMQEVVNNVRSGAPLHATLSIGGDGGARRLSAADAEDERSDSEEDCDMFHADVFLKATVRRSNGPNKSTTGKGAARSRW